MKIKEKFLQLSKFELIAWGLVIALLLMLVAVRQGKAQQFTNTSKPVSFGTLTTTNAMTVSFTYTSDTGSNKLRGSTFFECGGIKAYVGYPYLIFNSGSDNWQILLTSTAGYSRGFNKKPHRWTFRIGEGKKEVLIDSFMLATKTYSSTINQSSTLWFSSSSDIDKLSGTISDVVVSSSYARQPIEVAMPPGEQDERNLPPNYTTGQWENVPSVYQQLLDMPAPKYTNAMPKIRPLFNYRNLGGWLNPNISKDSAITAAVAIADLMCSKFNCTLLAFDNLQDLWDYYAQPNSIQNKYNMAMVNLANSHPEYEVEVGFGMAQMHDSRNGYKVLTEDQIKAVLPNTPLSTFDGNRYVLKEQLELMRSLLRRPINYINWDNEWYNLLLDTVKYQNNSACRAAKEASHLDWWSYCSQQYTAQVAWTVQDIKMIAPEAQQSEYDVTGLDACQQYYFPKYKYRSGLNYLNRGSGQVYPCSNRAALYGYSTFRGFMNYAQVDLKAYSEQGVGLFTPFLQPGSSGIPEQTMTPTAATGLATLLFGAGAYTIHPSVFYDLGLSPNEKSLAWQLAYCSYAQSSFSKHPDILLKGRLLMGDHSMAWTCFGANDHTFWTGDKECPAEVMQYGNECFITLSRIFLVNTKPLNGAGNVSSGTGIWLYGKYIPLTGRNQGSVWYYRTDLPVSADNPKVENGNVKFGDSQNWDDATMQYGDN